jgi:hypothetical protein
MLCNLSHLSIESAGPQGKNAAAPAGGEAWSCRLAAQADCRLPGCDKKMRKKAAEHGFGFPRDQKSGKFGLRSSDESATRAALDEGTR